jgi:hypothetical protein
MSSNSTQTAPYRTRSQAPPDRPQPTPRFVRTPPGATSSRFYGYVAQPAQDEDAEDEDVDEDVDEELDQDPAEGSLAQESPQQPQDAGVGTGRRAGNLNLLAAAAGASLGPLASRGAAAVDADGPTTPRRRSGSFDARRGSPQGATGPPVSRQRGGPSIGLSQPSVPSAAHRSPTRVHRDFGQGEFNGETHSDHGSPQAANAQGEYSPPFFCLSVPLASGTSARPLVSVTTGPIPCAYYLGTCGPASRFSASGLWV